MLPPLSFAHIAHRLGISDRPRGWQLKHVRFLIDQHGFPPPLPARAWRANSMSWDRRPIDHWFDERAGRSAVQSADQIAQARAAQLLDQRAAALSGNLAGASA